jgi:hypothetical protein
MPLSLFTRLNLGRRILAALSGTTPGADLPSTRLTCRSWQPQFETTIFATAAAPHQRGGASITRCATRPASNPLRPRGSDLPSTALKSIGCSPSSLHRKALRFSNCPRRACPGIILEPPETVSTDEQTSWLAALRYRLGADPRGKKEIAYYAHAWFACLSRFGIANGGFVQPSTLQRRR